MNRFVLDACCLIAFFNQEKGFEVVERILSEENEVYISIVNVFEICYDLERSNPEVNGTDIYEDILELPIQIEDKIDKIHLQHSIYFKNKYRISVADAFALGLAKKVNAKIVTADHHEFDLIYINENLEFEWIR